MDRVSGRYRDGRIELDSPVDWNDGIRVYVTPREPSWGMDEADWPTDPEGLAALVKSISEMEPPQLTPEDEAEIAAAREAVKKVTLEAVRRKMGL